MNMVRVLLLLSILSTFFSCSIPKVYRATIGVSSNNSAFKSVTFDEDDDRIERSLCVEEVSREVGNDQKCSGGGFKEDVGLGYFDPWVEFRPYYFGKSNFGFSYFFAFNRSETTLLDYPIVGDKSDIEIDRVSFNPVIYYNIGKRYIKNGDMSFRLGLGGALNYVTRFSIHRHSTDEEHHVTTKIKPGWAAFVEFNYSWFTFRAENSQIEYEGRKFKDVEKDILVVENNKASIYYSYYF